MPILVRVTYVTRDSANVAYTAVTVSIGLLDAAFSATLTFLQKVGEDVATSDVAAEVVGMYSMMAPYEVS